MCALALSYSPLRLVFLHQKKLKCSFTLNPWSWGQIHSESIHTESSQSNRCRRVRCRTENTSPHVCLPSQTSHIFFCWVFVQDFNQVSNASVVEFFSRARDSAHFNNLVPTPLPLADELTINYMGGLAWKTNLWGRVLGTASHPSSSVALPAFRMDALTVDLFSWPRI